MRRTEFRSPLAFITAMARRFGDVRTLQTAGALSFTTLLALVPLLTIALWAFSGIPAFAEVLAAFERFLAAHLLPEGALGAPVTDRITEFSGNAARLGTLGLAFLLAVAILLLLTVEETLNRIFAVTRRRSLLRRLLVYAVLLALGPVLIGASLTMTTYVAGASIGLLDLGEAARTALGVLPFAFTCVALTLLYFLGPNRRVEPGHALLGGLFAAALFELAKRGFASFVAKFPTYTLIYGAFAALPMFLLWLYLSWLVVLVGATLTAQLTVNADEA
ncbi:MAG: YihY family inner membrane protein [Burkholderiales bacterium]